MSKKDFQNWSKEKLLHEYKELLKRKKFGIVWENKTEEVAEQCKTSLPVFHDPRPGKLMTQLPLKNEKEITLGTDKVHYKPKPGTMIFIPAYLTHEYIVDAGIEDFRFIHFNLQAVRKMITDTVRVQARAENKTETKKEKK